MSCLPKHPDISECLMRNQSCTELLGVQFLLSSHVGRNKCDEERQNMHLGDVFFSQHHDAFLCCVHQAADGRTARDYLHLSNKKWLCAQMTTQPWCTVGETLPSTGMRKLISQMNEVFHLFCCQPKPISSHISTSLTWLQCRDYRHLRLIHVEMTH